MVNQTRLPEHADIVERPRHPLRDADPPNARSQRQAVGARLKEWRVRRGWSQSRVARSSSITQAALSNYERGKRDVPLSTLIRLATALDVTLGALLDVPEVIVVRDSRLGRALEVLAERPELLDLFSKLAARHRASA